MRNQKKLNDELMFLIDEPELIQLSSRDSVLDCFEKIGQFIHDLGQFALKKQGPYFAQETNPLLQFANQLTSIHCQFGLLRYSENLNLSSEQIEIKKAELVGQYQQIAKIYLTVLKKYYDYLKTFSKPVSKIQTPPINKRLMNASEVSSQHKVHYVARYNFELNLFFKDSSITSDTIEVAYQWAMQFVAHSEPLFQLAEFTANTKEEWLQAFLLCISNMNDFINLTEFSNSFMTQELFSAENVVRVWIEKAYQFIFSCYLTSASLQECKDLYCKWLKQQLSADELLEQYQAFLGRQLTNPFKAQNIAYREMYEANAQKYQLVLNHLKNAKPFVLTKLKNNDVLQSFISNCMNGQVKDAILNFLSLYVVERLQINNSVLPATEFMRALKKQFMQCSDIASYQYEMNTLQTQFAERQSVFNETFKEALDFVQHCLKELTLLVPVNTISNSSVVSAIPTASKY